jgi:hypothetical protein
VAVSAVNAVSVVNGSDLSSYATASYTPTADRLMIAAVHNRGSASGITPDTPTLSGNGLTWSQVVTYLPDNTGTQYRATVFVAKSGASPSAGAVTADFGGVNQGGCIIVVDEFDGADLTGAALDAIIQNKTGATTGGATSETITLDGAIGSGNATYGTFMHEANEGNTPGSGYTELADQFTGTGMSMSIITEYRADGQTTVDASWTTSIQHGGIALEINDAGGGGGGDPTSAVWIQ